MVEYHGVRDTDGNVQVVVQGRQQGPQLLQPFVRHSPTELERGYAGIAPADLACSILADHLGQCLAPVARVYQRFKHEVAAQLPRAHWTLTSQEVALWLEGALRTLDVQCPFCGDEGSLRPDQYLTLETHPAFWSCTCAAGAVVAELARQAEEE